MKLDLKLRARVFSLERMLKNLALDGVGFLGANAITLLVQYDARRISQKRLLSILLSLEKQVSLACVLVLMQFLPVFLSGDTASACMGSSKWSDDF